MPALTFPVSSNPGRLPDEGDGRRVNAYAEKRGERVYIRRVPGLTAHVTTPGAGPRGAIDVNGTLYVAYAGIVVAIAANLSVTTVGSLPGTDGVTFARNNRTTGGVSTPDVVAVRESGGAYTVTGSSVSAYPDADLPTPNSVSFLDGYFLFTIADGRIFASELNSTDVNALSFTTAESNPDGLVRGFVANGRFHAMGTASIEVYLNVGNSPFPLARATSVISVGALATMAVAGAGEGWDMNPFFVARDLTVREITGYTTRVVSTPDVDDFLAGSAASTLEAYTYTFRGRSIWGVSSNAGTWECDVKSGAWHERTSQGLGRWRASRSLKSGDRWLVADTQSGAIFRVDDAAKTEAGNPLVSTIEGILRDYPERANIPDLLVDVSATAGSVAISWSLNGGTTYGAPITKAMKPSGRSFDPVRVNRLGVMSNRGLRVRLQISDTNEFSLMGASVPGLGPEQRRAA